VSQPAAIVAGGANKVERLGERSVLGSDRNDPTNGVVGAASPLGSQLLGSHEEEEVEFEAGEVTRRVLIVRTERESAAAA